MDSSSQDALHFFFIGMDQFREKDSSHSVTEGPKDWFTGFY